MKIRCRCSAAEGCAATVIDLRSILYHINIPFFKKLLSFIYPVSLRRSEGALNAHLEIFLYRNQLRLATADAFYSDGDRYFPATATVADLKNFMPSVNNVLVLGAGLGSMVYVLHKKDRHPHVTLVENDKVILRWAMEFMPDAIAQNVEPVCTDAMAFIDKNTRNYDLIFIDVFNGRVVPDFVFTPVFLGHCRNSLAPGGHVAFNYIVNEERQWEKVNNIFSSAFPGSHVLDRGINRILIGGI